MKQAQQHNRIRLQYNRTQGTDWQLQSMLNLHSMDGSGLGYALSQRVRYRRNWWQASLMLTYFHTPDYDTRIFLYEPLLTNMFRYPSLFGHGLRWVLAAHCEFWQKRLLAELLYGATRYTDRRSQGSGMQEIRSPWKQDITFQLRLRI